MRYTLIESHTADGGTRKKKKNVEFMIGNGGRKRRKTYVRLKLVD
jgi:hypothetical protein